MSSLGTECYTFCVTEYCLSQEKVKYHCTPNNNFIIILWYLSIIFKVSKEVVII
jgi:hypothetical protein